MKIYILLRHVDYEGSDVLAVYRERAVAEAWKQWCTKNNSALNESIGEPGGLYDREWDGRFPVFPGDSYSVEEHDMRAAMPSNAKVCGT